jgi:peptidoglycan-associated lipoprotein
MPATTRWLVGVAAAALLVGGGCVGKKPPADDPTDSGPPETPVGEEGAGFGTPDGKPTPGGTTEKPPVGEWELDLERQLRPIFFAFDKYDLSQESRDTLTENARVLRQNADALVRIEGHCDERGTNEYNLALGDRRARAARDFLVGAGVNADSLTVVPFGEEKPFASGHDESAWAQNRRAHFDVDGRKGPRIDG